MAWRARTPTIIQMEAVECGPASLGMILGYFGYFLPLEALRLDCAVDREGTNAKILIDVGKKYGLDGKGIRIELDEIEKLSSPVIVFWEYNHFLVLEGVKKDKVFLNDPATGSRSMSREEFKRGFTGIVLKFTPASEFVKKGKPRSILKDVLLKLTSAKSSLILLFVTTFLLLLPGLALPAFIRFFVDQVIAAQIFSWYSQITLGLFFAFFYGAAVIMLQQFVSNRLESKLSIDFSSAFFKHVLKLPIAFYAARFSGEIVQRILANERVARSISTDFLKVFFDLSVIVVYGAIILSYSWIIGVIACLAAFINIALFIWFQELRSNDYVKKQQEGGKWTTSTAFALQQIKTIKASGLEESVFNRFASGYAQNISIEQKLEEKDSLLSAVPVLLQGLVIAGLLLLGTLFVLEGKLTIGMLAALAILLLSFLSPINRLVNFGMKMQNLKTDINRLNDVLEYEVDPLYKNINTNKSSEKEKLNGHLEFRNVTFGYNPIEPAIIEDLSFTIKPGHKVALVGPSGVGKSTIVKLALGLYRPWKGEILYDGRSIDDIPHDIFHRSISSVDQAIFLFSGSIRENLSLWDLSVTNQMLIEAAKDAKIHEEILSRKDGYDAKLYENGDNLSGGQRQQLEIARALLYRPSILILDEATSALDPQTEKEINDMIRQKGVSKLMITQRISSIQDCDEIIILEAGKVLERGIHQELKEANGLYQKLFTSEKS